MYSISWLLRVLSLDAVEEVRLDLMGLLAEMLVVLDMIEGLCANGRNISEFVILIRLETKMKWELKQSYDELINDERRQLSEAAAAGYINYTSMGPYVV
jgi:hypothetical protein